jgi:hypothetical protein
MRYGTAHFKTLRHAIRYYDGYGYDDTAKAVDRKLSEGEIHIGEPESLKADETFSWDKDGRGVITVLDPKA